MSNIQNTNQEIQIDFSQFRCSPVNTEAHSRLLNGLEQFKTKCCGGRIEIVDHVNRESTVKVYRYYDYKDKRVHVDECEKGGDEMLVDTDWTCSCCGNDVTHQFSGDELEEYREILEEA